MRDPLIPTPGQVTDLPLQTHHTPHRCQPTRRGGSTTRPLLAGLPVVATPPLHLTASSPAVAAPTARTRLIAGCETLIPTPGQVTDLPLQTHPTHADANPHVGAGLRPALSIPAHHAHRDRRDAVAHRIPCAPYTRYYDETPLCARMICIGESPHASSTSR